jgi:hypothetical protein
MRITQALLLSGFAAAFTLLFSWHVFATAVYNVPENPISLAATPLVDKYMFPFFTQAWNFFAPTPMDNDSDALYRIRYRVADGRTVTSGWISLVETLNRQVRHNPLSPKALVREGLFSSIVDAANNKFYYGELHSRGGRRRFADAAHQPYPIIALERTAMALVPLQLRRGTPYQIQLVTIVREYPRFSRRNEDPGPDEMLATYATLPWTAGEWIASIR